VLRDVDVDVRPGEMVALGRPERRGPRRRCATSSPASTTRRRGRCWLDGVDLRDIDADSYRRLLGIVEQDTFLFDGTIADNIAYGRRGRHAGADRRRRPAANAHEFIEAAERATTR
jgi:ATP-binding cassette subfamily B protein/subfamily B ATP-binding cassette protein MsbA